MFKKKIQADAQKSSLTQSREGKEACQHLRERLRWTEPDLKPERALTDREAPSV